MLSFQKLPRGNLMSYQKLSRNHYFKLALPNGFDFYSGKTINYRESIGKKVSVTKEMYDVSPKLCSSTVIHASRNPNDCFVGAKIPCSAYIVKGLPVIKEEQKCGFKQLFVESEIPHETFNDVFGWKIIEAETLVHPFKIAPPIITNQQIELLKNWASVWASVRDSVRASVRASVGASVRDSVRDSVWASVRASVGASVRDSVWDSVWASVGASVRASVGASVRDSHYAYAGTFFPDIKTWKYIKHEKGVYPFQAAADLWLQGLVPACAQDTWYLLGGSKAEILYTWKKET